MMVSLHDAESALAAAKAKAAEMGVAVIITILDGAAI
jgi:uncharacterized protein GlcG (DUF336 family)